MAPMITDSYTKYNSSDFGATNKSSQFFSSTSSKPFVMANNNSGSNNNNNQSSFKYSTTFDDSDFDIGVGTKKTASNDEESVISSLKGNNAKKHLDTFDELISQCQSSVEALLNYRKPREFLDSLGQLLLSTSSPDVQRNALRFLQTYLKALDKIRVRRKTETRLDDNFKRLDQCISDDLLKYLIEASVSNKLQLKQMSIDVIYSYMKLTDSVSNNCFAKFIKHGIENANETLARTFIDPTLSILITEELAASDFTPIVQALVKRLAQNNSRMESACLKCLNKIETVVKPKSFGTYINKLPANLQEAYEKAAGQKNKDSVLFDLHSNKNDLTNIEHFNGGVGGGSNDGLRYNFIPASITQNLAGENEIQRLQAMSQLEQCVKEILDIKKVYPHYQDFIQFMNNYVDDLNYEMRVSALRILSLFVQKLGTNVNQCYKAICSCARSVLSQTHQSKTMKQYLTSMLIMTIDLMINPVFVFDSLLERIKDRPAKAREEILNIITASVLKFSSDKFDSLRKVFYQVVPLMCDIKRNVRHAALESIAVLYVKIKENDRSWGNLLDQLEHVPDLHNSDNLSSIREVILYRVNRNKVASLNADFSVEYAVKIPSSGVSISNNHDLDIEWIISASSTSSATVSSQSSARSQRSYMPPTNENNNQSLNRNLNDNMFISSGTLRRPSAVKRIPWDDLINAEIPSNNNNNTSSSSHSAPKTSSTRSREPQAAAPLKAFPLNDDFLSGFSSSQSKSSYPSTTSYQEKYLKKTLSDVNKLNSSKTDSQIEMSDAAKRLQSEKAYSLDNLYNFDETINSEENVQKRKYANSTIKQNNGVIPSKPVIARRNSATKFNNSESNRSGLNLFDQDEDFNHHFMMIDDSKSLLSDRDSLATGTTESKYDTVPNIRNSAKNRRKLEKIFSIGHNDENNAYLSKLKADKTTNGNQKNDQINNSSSRYSASNPESGIFSISDFDQSENRFIKMQQNYNSDGSSKKTTNLNNKSSNNVEYKPHSGVSFKPTHASDVEIVGVKLVNGNDNLSSEATSHSISLAQKKKNQLKNLNESNFFNLDKDVGNDILDIVGKGYNNSETDKLFDTNNDSNYVPSIQEDNQFPLSSSFKSRLRQKTMEKQEEKQRKHIEKQQQKQKRDNDSIYDDMSTQGDYNSDYQSNKNFGLSISGYGNGVATNGSRGGSGHQDESALNLDEFPVRGRTVINYNELEFDESAFAATTVPADKPKHQPTKATQARLKAKAAALAAATTPSNEETQSNMNSLPPTAPNSTRRAMGNNTSGGAMATTSSGGGGGAARSDEYDPNVGQGVKEEYLQQPFKNAEAALREAMNNLAQDEDWEKKCHAMNSIRRLSVYHEDVAVSNIHQIILALVQEVKNLRSQVARFALLTFGDLFCTLKKFMDVDLELTVKTILQKNTESNEFIRSDVDKCLDKMVNNVSTTKAIVALLNGGASHRNPLVRRTTAQYIYRCCEIMGPGKLLSGIKDVTERVIVTASQFVVDGPPDIRWFGRKIFYILMSHEDFDRLLVKYLNEAARKNIKEILDTIRVKGPGEAPHESARNMRKNLRSVDSVSRSAGVSNMNATLISSQQQQHPEATMMRGSAAHRSTSNHSSAHTASASGYAPPRPLDQQTQEDVKTICAQLRNADFRQRMDAIERFRVVCETKPNVAIINIVQFFDKFNACLTDTNSKVSYKALDTMHQITPILGNDLTPVITNVVPLIAQNLASKNSEIQDMAANILDVLVEYLDGGLLIQPFTNLAQHGNARVKPYIIFKLADIIPNVYSSKKKQVDLHVLPCLWVLLNTVKGNGSGQLNNSIHKLVNNLYEQMGEQLIDRAASSSNVSNRNLELLKDMLSLPAY